MVTAAILALVWAEVIGRSIFCREMRVEWVDFPTVADAVVHGYAKIDSIFRREVVLEKLPRTARPAIRAARRLKGRSNGRACGPASFGGSRRRGLLLAGHDFRTASFEFVIQARSASTER